MRECNAKDSQKELKSKGRSTSEGSHHVLLQLGQEFGQDLLVMVLEPMELREPRDEEAFTARQRKRN